MPEEEREQCMERKAVIISVGNPKQWLHESTERRNLGNHGIVNRLAEQGRQKARTVMGYFNR